jgi:hypothetical protein
MQAKTKEQSKEPIKKESDMDTEKKKGGKKKGGKKGQGYGGY